MHYRRIAMVLLMGISLLACKSTEKQNANNYFISKAIPAGSSIAVIVKRHNSFKNAIIMEFLNAGYKVNAVNANEFYGPGDIYKPGELSSSEKERINKLSAILSQLQFYEHEQKKQKIINDLRRQNDIDYLVLMDLTNWNTGYSWVRAIETKKQSIVYVHNLKIKRSESVQQIMQTIIERMKEGPAET